MSTPRAATDDGQLFVPETGVPMTMGTVTLEVERIDVNIIDAAGRGMTEALAPALNVAAMAGTLANSVTATIAGFLL